MLNPDNVEFKSQSIHFRRHLSLTSLSLSFLICETGTIIAMRAGEGSVSTYTVNRSCYRHLLRPASPSL